LPPSTALERAHLTQIARFHIGRNVLRHQAERLRGIARARYIGHAAAALRAVAGMEPQLSRTALLDDAQTRMMAAIDALRRVPMLGRRHEPTRSASPRPGFAHLHRRVVFAYDESPRRLTM